MYVNTEFVQVMENLESYEIEVFQFPGLESHGIYYYWSWKMIVCVICNLLQVSKQGQNKAQASYVRKYPKTRMILTIFKSGG